MMYNKISNPMDGYARPENKQDNHVFTCCVGYLEIIIIFDILIFYIWAPVLTRTKEADVLWCVCFFCSFTHFEAFLGKIKQKFDVLPP